MDKIKVAIVEDDLEWLNIIKILLSNEEDIIVVGIVTNKEEALKLADAINQIDIFLVDINLTENNLDGIYVALELKERGYAGKIIMLTSLNDADIIRTSFQAGVTDYFLKKNAPELSKLIRETYYERTPIEILANDYCRLKQEEQLNTLTPAEREVYELAEQGLTRTQIEKKLIKSENTIKSQIKNILKKMGVSSTKEAIKKVRSGGLL